MSGETLTTRVGIPAPLLTATGSPVLSEPRLIVCLVLGMLVGRILIAAGSLISFWVKHR